MRKPLNLCLLVLCFIGASTFAQTSNDIYLSADFKTSFTDCDYGVAPENREFKTVQNPKSVVYTIMDKVTSATATLIKYTNSKVTNVTKPVLFLDSVTVTDVDALLQSMGETQSSRAILYNFIDKIIAEKSEQQKNIYIFDKKSLSSGEVELISIHNLRTNRDKIGGTTSSVMFRQSLNGKRYKMIEITYPKDSDDIIIKTKE